MEVGYAILLTRVPEILWLGTWDYHKAITEAINRITTQRERGKSGQTFFAVLADLAKEGEN